jgi:hypothetical protein
MHSTKESYTEVDSRQVDYWLIKGIGSKRTKSPVPTKLQKRTRNTQQTSKKQASLVPN